MAVKVLINAVGQHLIADTKQIENKESGDVVGYWLAQPRLVYYNQGEDGEVSVNFGSYCLIAADNELSVRAEHIVTIMTPRDEVVEAWQKAVYGEDFEPSGDGTVTTEVADGVVPPAAVETTENVQPEEVVAAETTA